MSTAHRPTPAKRPRPDDGTSDTITEKEQKVHERYTTGDLEIVSSDGVCFRVNPAFLIAGSRVFRAMIEDGTSSQIQLTDEDIETEQVLTLLLSLLHGEALPTVNNFATFCPVIELINLARKYDCPAPLFMIQHFLRSTSGAEPTWAFACFVGLSTLKDVKGCAEAIRHGGDTPWDDDHGYTARNNPLLDNPVLREGWISTSVWPFEQVEQTNPLFFFALTRASRVITNSRKELSPGDLSRVADEFVRLLKSKDNE